MRALTFGGATSDRDDRGSGASIDNLASGDLTLWAWLYRTANGDNQYIMAKHQNFPEGFIFTLTNSFAEGGLQMFMGNATTRASYVSDTSNVVALNTWTFVAGTYNATAKTCKLYRGTMAAIVAEVSGYSSSTAGVGTVNSDASANLYIGNGQIGGTASAFKGRIGPCGLVSRALTVGELAQLQFSRRRHRAGCVMLGRLGENGTSTQPDWSGSGNTGTITGATAADGPPLRRP